MGEGLKIILDNIIFFLQQAGGGSVYWAELIKRLDKKDLEVEFVEPIGASTNIFYQKIKDTLIHSVRKERTAPKLLTFLPLSIKVQSRYIFHSSYYRISNDPEAINVVTIHDFMPEIYFRGLTRFYHSYRKRKAIKKAHGIVCVSHHTYEDLLSYYPKAIDKPVAIIHQGVSPEYRLVERKSNHDFRLPYVLYVGGRSSYKNFQFAVDLLYSLPKYHFVIAGSDFTRGEMLSLNKIHERYTLIKTPDNKTLNELYNNAHCLLYPSSYEGFGIPVIEAMAAGCPVVALNTSSIPEIANDAALLENHLTLNTFMKAIQDLESPQIRQSVIARGLENAKKYSWDKTVDELVSFYELLYSHFKE